jgi:hypothetical protein
MAAERLTLTADGLGEDRPDLRHRRVSRGRGDEAVAAEGDDPGADPHPFAVFAEAVPDQLRSTDLVDGGCTEEHAAARGVLGREVSRSLQTPDRHVHRTRFRGGAGPCAL